MSMYERGVLSAPAPQNWIGRSSQKGFRVLGLEDDRDGLLYVPQMYRRDKKLPMIVMLHGAGGNAQSSIALLQDLAEHTGFIVLAPESRKSTWDVITEDYGPDVEFLDRALINVFSLYPVDRNHLAVAGFSDGATYALSLGITNGDLFSHVIAFSPGFMVPGQLRGSPSIYVAHGVWDQVLPIDNCSRRIVPALLTADYKVKYREFGGGHSIPASIAREAVTWLLGSQEYKHAIESTVPERPPGIEREAPHVL